MSERLMYYTGKLARLRPDLADKVMAGEMSNSGACIEAGIRREPTSWDKLVRAWNAATDDDRDRLSFMILRAHRESEQ